MNYEEQHGISRLPDGRFPALEVDACVLKYNKWIEEDTACLLKGDVVFALIGFSFGRVPNESLTVTLELEFHSLNVYTLYGRRQLLKSEFASALNFRGFGRILYVQTNLSAALCAIRVAERGVGLQPTFSLD